MAQVGIFYGSSRGHTANVANIIRNALGTENSDIYNIKSATKEDIEQYPFLIFGTSTWGYGDIQHDWLVKLPMLDQINFDNKKVALFSLGEQQNYPDNFADGMSLLYEKLISKGAKVIGNWYPNGYIFNKSKALRHGSFVGLVLDEEFQPLNTKPRIEKWTNYLKTEFNLN